MTNPGLGLGSSSSPIGAGSWGSMTNPSLRICPVPSHFRHIMFTLLRCRGTAEKDSQLPRMCCKAYVIELSGTPVARVCHANRLQGWRSPSPVGRSREQSVRCPLDVRVRASGSYCTNCFCPCLKSSGGFPQCCNVFYAHLPRRCSEFLLLRKPSR